MPASVKGTREANGVLAFESRLRVYIQWTDVWGLIEDQRGVGFNENCQEIPTRLFPRISGGRGVCRSDDLAGVSRKCNAAGVGSGFGAHG